MGEDGHTASIFAGPDLDDALDAPKARRAVGVMPDPLPAEAPVPRVTLTRASILAAQDDPHHHHRAEEARPARAGDRGRAFIEAADRPRARRVRPADRHPLAPVMAIDPRISAVTDRIIERSKPSRQRYLDADRGRRRARDRPAAAELRQFRPRLCRRGRGQGGDPGDARAQHRHRHRLQRHALGASALRPLPRADEDLRARSRRHRAGRGRRPGDVRRGDAGPAGDGPVAVQPRHDRAVDRDRAQPRHVRSASRCSAFATRSSPAC